MVKLKIALNLSSSASTIHAIVNQLIVNQASAHCGQVVIAMLALLCRLLSLAEGLQHNAPPQQHLAAEGALNLALRLGVAPHVVLDRLLGQSKNASLYEAYRPVIHTWLIFNASACAGKLLEALAGSHGPPKHAQHAQRTAGLILNGCLESLQRSKDAQAGRPDVRQRCEPCPYSCCPGWVMLFRMWWTGGGWLLRWRAGREGLGFQGGLQKRGLRGGVALRGGRLLQGGMGRLG